MTSQKAFWEHVLSKYALLNPRPQQRHNLFEDEPESEPYGDHAQTPFGMPSGILNCAHSQKSEASIIKNLNNESKIQKRAFETVTKLEEIKEWKRVCTSAQPGCASRVNNHKNKKEHGSFSFGLISVLFMGRRRE